LRGWQRAASPALQCGFKGRPIQRRHFWLQRSNGRWHGNQILPK